MQTMTTMTAEQALEAGKNLDFAQVWSMMTARDQKMDQRWAKTEELLRQVGQHIHEVSERAKLSDKKTDEQLRALSKSAKLGDQKTDEQLRALSKSVKSDNQKTDEQLRALSKSVKNVQGNVGGVGNSLGAIMEGMFAANICPKFNAFGHTFTKVSNDQKYYKHGKLYCEVDSLLENGKYVLAIEVKARCEMRDINKHLERLQKLRAYMDKRDDHRIILGAIAAGSISDKLRETAEGFGLYVIVQNGSAVEIVEKPHEFKEGTW